MKKLILVLLGVSLLQLQLIAQSRTIKFQFDPVSTSVVSDVAAMESNISKLLSAINVAYIDGEPLSFSGVRIDSTAQKSLNLLWENLHFYCTDDINVSRCLRDFQGIQVRDISIILKPVAEYEDSLELDRELAVSLTKDGVITGVRMALSNNLYKSIMNDSRTVTDTRERMEILKFIEEMRGYYLSKNIEALTTIYSDSALIVENGFMHTSKTDWNVPYNEKKGRYLDNLKELFNRGMFVEVHFDRISIVRHHAKRQYIGATLHQTVKDNSQLDGWLFMLWDFEKPDQPVIHVHTWQFAEDAEKDGVMDLWDFFL